MNVSLKTFRVGFIKFEYSCNLKHQICRYINNGVYRSGFARSQEAYDKAVVELFEHLDKVLELNLEPTRHWNGLIIRQIELCLGA